MDKSKINNVDYIETIYESTLSAACRYHCVSHYDEAGLQLALRQDIVEAGLAPENVRALAAELQNIDFKIEGSGEILYYVDIYSNKSAVPQDCKIISGGDTGKALEVLGFIKESEAILSKFKAAVTKSGCKTLVTYCPASYDMLKDKLDNVNVMHSSEYLKPEAGSGKIYYLDSDFLKNYCGNLGAPRELLQKCGYKLIPFGTNPEESYAVGEGAVVYNKLNPQLAEKLCRRIVELTDDPQNDILVTASPYTKQTLNKYAPELTVLSLEEAVNRGVE